nr:MAG TPA: hypothetical protein [Caudoviricetes sp.]
MTRHLLLTNLSTFLLFNNLIYSLIELTFFS